MTETLDYHTYKFDNAASMIRIQGILSIIFGGLGIIGSLLASLYLALVAVTDPTIAAEDGVIAAAIIGAFVFVFVLLPHVYLIVSGMHLLKNPAPNTAKVLIIINLIIGVFWNLVIFVFAIINLTQLHDYQVGYKSPAHKHATPDHA